MVKRNLHYGKLPLAVAQGMTKQMPGTLVAGCFRTTEISQTSLNHMRDFSVNEAIHNVNSCFACANEEIVCPENKRIECLCGRAYYKYYDVTDYSKFVEQSRWKLFWIRLTCKMSSILRRPKSS